MLNHIWDVTVPVVCYDQQTEETDSNLSFKTLAGDMQMEKVLSLLIQYIKEDITQGALLPSAKSIRICGREYDAIHLTPIGDNAGLHLVLLAQSVSNSEFITLKKNDAYEMLHYLQNNFVSIISALYNDLVLVDKNGRIKAVMPSFEYFYGIPPSQVLNKTVYDLEKERVLLPSVAASVLRTGQEECLLQRTLTGKYLMCYGVPIFDANGDILNVLSYSRDLTQYELMKQQYDYLKETIRKYSASMLEQEEAEFMCADIIGFSDEMKVLKNTLNMYAKFDANVLLTGESGVGKTLYAKVIHNQSARKAGPFVDINCGAIPDNLFESEFFGYEKGAFTGANAEGKMGLVERAHNGTLFLDEIADLPKTMQVKLLKVLDSQTITKVGGFREIPVNFKLIAATNKNIPQLIQKGEFREDLYFRLNLLTLEIPPLRKRSQDIPALARYFSEKCLEKYNTSKLFSTQAISALMDYSWPGNIRELKNVVEKLCLITSSQVIDVAHIPSYILENSAAKESSPSYEGRTLPEILASVEKQVILDAYKKYKSTTKMAAALGISQPSASIKLKKYLNQD